MTFQEIPQQDNDALTCIKDPIIKKMYSNFIFLYYQYPPRRDGTYLNSPKNSNYNDNVINYLKNYNFLTFHILHSIISSNNKLRKDNDENIDIYDLIFCVEGKCLIIEQIDISSIKQIITELKKNKKALINVGTNDYEDNTIIKDQVVNEIYNFCLHFRREILANHFVKRTISSISCYCIRRYFYPSYYFRDKSFFSFDEIKSKEQQIKSLFSRLILSQIPDEENNEEFEGSFNEDEDQNKEKLQFNEEENKEEEEAFLKESSGAFEEEIGNDYEEEKEEEEVDYEEEIKDDYEEEKEEEEKEVKEEENNEIIRSSISSDKTISRIKFKNDKLYFIRWKSQKNFDKLAKFSNREFSLDDFIILRTIYTKENASFYLVIHLESLYIFMMKKIINNKTVQNETNHEINYCQHFHHRCFTRFYGFLKENGEIAGFIYEYMCNGSLFSFINSNNDKINEIYKMMTVNRIYQGILFLHSKSLIHRDFKPYNILLDHDYIPYISDFETIRQPSNKEMTTDIGSLFFASPEQIKCMNYSYPTDIYAFGQIIYFLFENKDVYKLNSTEILQMTKGSKIIQDIYESCVKKAPSERSTVQQLKPLLIKEVNSYHYFEEYFLNHKLPTTDFEMVQFLYENIILNNHEESLDECEDHIYYFFFLYKLRKFDGMAEFNFTVGYHYKIGKYVNQNYTKAKYYYELSAQEGNCGALNNLALLYKNGQGVTQDYSIAIKYLKKAAKLDDKFAMYNLGFLYDKGIGVQRNYWKAKKYYEKTSHYLMNEPNVNLGNLYYYGHGVEQNIKKAKYYYQKSEVGYHNLGIVNLKDHQTRDYLKKSEHFFYSDYLRDEDIIKSSALLGDAFYYGLYGKQDYAKAKEYYSYLTDIKTPNYFQRSINNLGDIYLNGLGGKQDYGEAKKCFEMTAEYNNSDAFLKLGEMYENGYGVGQDYHKAKEYYEKSAKNNSSEALFKLGNLYYNGLGVKKDISYAEHLYELLSQQNDSDIFIDLGDVYSEGKSANQDYIKAKKYYELAAKQDNLDAYFKLALLYYHGRGVNQDYSKAKEYYDLIFTKSISEHYLKLGDINENGIGVVTDPYKALYYYEKSAKHGNTKALLKLGDFYCFVKKDYLKAKDYYERLEKHNDPEAYLKLGNMYENGNGVEIDYKQAKHYYELAAKQYNSEALFKLGYFHFNGFGVEKNYLQARFYFKYSADYCSNTKSMFYFAYLYSTGDFFEINDKKAIKYYKRCISFHYEEVEKNDLVNQEFSKWKLNRFRDRSKNDIGLIFLLNSQKMKKACKYIKSAALNEYPFAQNNFGLFNQIYLKNIQQAIYMFQKASKSYFALSMYNLGYLYEKDKKYEESIRYYRQASEFEDKPLMFRNNNHFDKRLEISKCFIICFTNLKLTFIYLSMPNEEEAKNFFFKAFSKLNSYKFEVSTRIEINEIFFKLKNFILKHPLFNLINQPNLNQELLQYLNNLKDFNYSKDNFDELSTNSDDSFKKEVFSETEKDLFNLDSVDFEKIKERVKQQNQSFYVLKKKNESSDDENCNFDDLNTTQNEDNNHALDNEVIDNPNDLFDFSMKDDEIKKIFIQTINEIVQFMEKILYQPPYFILFGRICITKPPILPKEDINLNQKEINRSFYEGFEIDI